MKLSDNWFTIKSLLFSGTLNIELDHILETFTPFEDKLLFNGLRHNLPTESIFTVCRFCAAKMNMRDEKWHWCRNMYKFNLYTSMSIVTDSISNACKSVLFTIFILENLLCKDMAIKIGKLIYESRYDISLWYRDKRRFDGWDKNTIANTRRYNREKNRKSRKRLTKKHNY